MRFLLNRFSLVIRESCIQTNIKLSLKLQFYSIKTDQSNMPLLSIIKSQYTCICNCQKYKITNFVYNVYDFRSFEDGIDFHGRHSATSPSNVTTQFDLFADDSKLLNSRYPTLAREAINNVYELSSFLFFPDHLLKQEMVSKKQNGRQLVKIIHSFPCQWYPINDNGQC